MEQVSGDVSGLINEEHFREWTHGLSDSQCAQVAASFAERLIPLYAAVLKRGGTAYNEDLRSALDLAWAANPSTSKIERALAVIEELVMDENEDLSPDNCLAQNAVAATIYTLRTLATKERQNVFWAAMQLIDAADYLVQRTAPFGEYLEFSIREESSRLVRDALQHTFRDIELYDSDSLRSLAKSDAALLVKMFDD